jgi:hypothetical protein
MTTKRGSPLTAQIQQTRLCKRHDGIDLVFRPREIVYGKRIDGDGAYIQPEADLEYLRIQLEPY